MESILYYTHMIPHHLDTLLKNGQEVDKLFAPRKAVLARFPLLFTLLVTFGLTATIYGFEKLVDRVAYLNDHPFVLFLMGLAILTFTGSLYKRLGRVT